MPIAFFLGAFWEANPRRWEVCRKDAASQMLAEGWILKSKKFNEVQNKRALKLWRSKC
jgi:hypothetical protein